MIEHDPIDHAIAALVALRELGLRPFEVEQLIRDVYAAPWTCADDPAWEECWDKPMTRAELKKIPRLPSSRSKQTAAA